VLVRSVIAKIRGCAANCTKGQCTKGRVLEKMEHNLPHKKSKAILSISRQESRTIY
jgi:hypothetical protein